MPRFFTSHNYLIFLFPLIQNHWKAIIVIKFSFISLSLETTLKRIPYQSFRGGKPAIIAICRKIKDKWLENFSIYNNRMVNIWVKYV